MLSYCLPIRRVALSVHRFGWGDVKQLIKLIDNLDAKGLVIKLDKKDIESSYSAGSSKGGQKANKSHSLVLLRHVPTGKTGEGRESRMLPDNYKFALARLRKAVDIELKGNKSIFVILEDEEREKARVKDELKQKLKETKRENEAKLKSILSEEDTLKY